jgi:hypothetical protein
MVVAQAVRVDVRPFQISQLCFEVGGILGESFVELGADISAFPFDFFYKAFRATPAVANARERPGRLEFDSAAIDLKTKTGRLVKKNAPLAPPFALAALRAEPVRAALDKAINARANAVITKYANAEPIISNMKETARIKGELLPRLSDGMTLQTQLLFKEYEKHKLTGAQRVEDGVEVGTVVKLATNVTRSDVARTHTASTDRDAAGTIVATSLTDSDVRLMTPGNETVTGSQATTTRLVEFRAPSLECLSRNERVQLMLRDEQTSHFLQTLYLDQLQELFTNELASIDADVNQLQIAYLNTILLSPISGRVTGVYKTPGDTVRPGEPVFRVENDADILVVAQLVCRSLAVESGARLSITGNNHVDSNSNPVHIVADIVAARRQGADDRWEVIGKCANVGASATTKLLPLGYQFDYNRTTIHILAAGEVDVIP